MKLGSETALKALLVSASEKLQRVVRRVLSDLDIQVVSCVDGETAVQKLTRQRFEAVIVDFSDSVAADQIVRGVQVAPGNKRAVIVAFVDADVALGAAFSHGAHFVLHKSWSAERTKSSFRAVRALMKRERRRNQRIPVEIPVTCRWPGKADISCQSADLGEGGMALRLPRTSLSSGAGQLSFFVPQGFEGIEVGVEVAWRNPQGLIGVRFTRISPEARHELKVWIDAATGEHVEEQEGPVPAELTDLSLHACYLKIASPFPLCTRVALVLRVGIHDLRAEGTVRVVHPEVGMGVEFLQKTEDEQVKVKAFLEALRSESSQAPQIFVEPEEMDPDAMPLTDSARLEADPLLALFVRRDELSPEDFQSELTSQRGSMPVPTVSLGVTSILQ
jgi:CheY-like chemotaxis protein